MWQAKQTESGRHPSRRRQNHRPSGIHSGGGRSRRHLRWGHQSNAFTLIEVIGTLSVLLVLGVAAASILGSVTGIAATNRRATHGRAMIERLARVFRNDVNLAGGIELTDDAWPLYLSHNDTRIEYQWDSRDHAMLRRVDRGGVSSSVDRFQLLERCNPRVTVDDESVTLRLAGERQPWTIEATRP